MASDYVYQVVLGIHFKQSFDGVLPKGKSNPQRVALGLYAEQLSGSAFTAFRKENFSTWFAIKPSVAHGPFTEWKSHHPLAMGR